MRSDELAEPVLLLFDWFWLIELQLDQTISDGGNHNCFGYFLTLFRFLGLSKLRCVYFPLSRLCILLLGLNQNIMAQIQLGFVRLAGQMPGVAISHLVGAPRRVQLVNVLH